MYAATLSSRSSNCLSIGSEDFLRYFLAVKSGLIDWRLG
jgi:hypothetical protein